VTGQYCLSLHARAHRAPEAVLGRERGEALAHHAHLREVNGEEGKHESTARKASTRKASSTSSSVSTSGSTRSLRWRGRHQTSAHSVRGKVQRQCRATVCVSLLLASPAAGPPQCDSWVGTGSWLSERALLLASPAAAAPPHRRRRRREPASARQCLSDSQFQNPLFRDDGYMYGMDNDDPMNGWLSRCAVGEG
jgi:hypothetical protein